MQVAVPALPSGGLTLLSGGAEGADALFDALMAEHSPNGRCLHWSWQGHRGFAARLEGRVDLPQDVAAQVADPWLITAARQLGQSVPKNPAVKALFRRNVFQVLWADAVYLITWEDEEAKYPLRIGGGTKWAAQVYIDRFQPLGPEPAERCHLFLYEVNSAVWKSWDQRGQAWLVLGGAPEPLEAPLRFAGIGTRTVPSHAIEAARALFRLSRPVGDVHPKCDAAASANAASGITAGQVAASISQFGRARRRWGPVQNSTTGGYPQVQQQDT